MEMSRVTKPSIPNVIESELALHIVEQMILNHQD